MNTIYKWTYITLSALLAAAAFIQPLWFAELVFIFLIPLFYAILKYDFLPSYKEGFWWGILFYLIFFSGIFYVIIHKGHGTGRGLAISFLLVYASSTSALWFGFARKMSVFINNYTMNPTIILASWVSVTWLYFYWIDKAFFCIFGNCEGNQLNHPVVPLAIRPAWLYVLPLFGKNFFFALIISIAALFSLALIQNSKKKLIMSILCCVPFLIGWIPFLQKNSIPPWVKNIGCIVPYTHDANPWVAAEHIMFLLEDFQKKNSEIKCIIMPESSFKFPLNLYKRCLSLWPLDGVSLLIGSHRKEGDYLFNTLYHIKKGIIIDLYDKYHTFFFTEYVPPFWSYFSYSSDLFLKDHVPITQSKKSNKGSLCCFGKFIIPYICSDFFFMKDGLVRCGYSLCIVNDSWFNYDYIPLLMSLHAKVMALIFQNSIIYVGYRHCMFIANDGNHYLLPKLVG